MKLALVAAIALIAVPKATLPQMTVPDATLKRVAPSLSQKTAFFTTHDDAAASTFDPNDTGADLKRLGRVAGYIRGRIGSETTGLSGVATSVILWRDARVAATSITRDAADGRRFRGKNVAPGVLVSFDAKKIPALGRGAELWHFHVRGASGVERFTTSVVFTIRALRGNALVIRGDNKEADALALQLARDLESRIVARLRASS